jgi:hypothetical protein
VNAGATSQAKRLELVGGGKSRVESGDGKRKEW